MSEMNPNQEEAIRLLTEKLKEDKIGYHIKHIEKGVLGESSKIREEFEEFLDAEMQGISLMQLMELSDMMGAIEAYLKKHFPDIAITDLLTMSWVTQRAFKNGHR